jgi:hypothetical protein
VCALDRDERLDVEPVAIALINQAVGVGQRRSKLSYPPMSPL